MNPYTIVPYIRLCLYRECFKGWTLPMRTISDHELVLIIGGKGYFSIEGTKYPVKKGMLFYFYPGLLHSAHTELDEPMRFYAVHFSFVHVNYSGEQWNMEKTEEILPINPVQVLANHLIPSDYIKKLLKCWNDKRPGYELLTRSLFQQFLFSILTSINSSEVNYSGQIKVENILNHIHANIEKRLGLEELAGISGLTPQYFSKLFKSTMGETVMQYINRIKIDRAKEMLAGGNRKVKEVSILLGFKDEFYFSRVFKKLEGISPNDFNSKSDFNVKKVHGN